MSITSEGLVEAGMREICKLRWGHERVDLIRAETQACIRAEVRGVLSAITEAAGGKEALEMAIFGVEWSIPHTHPRTAIIALLRALGGAA